MKKNNSSLISLSLAAALVCTLLISAISSCSKTNANAEFLGTYAGTQTINGAAAAPDTLTITAGSNSTSIVITYKSAGGNTAVNATVNSNTITIPSQTISIQGAAATISGTGGLGGSSLALTFTEVVTATSTSYAGSFSGTKE